MLKIKAFAKINFELHILGKRPDGYHELCSLMQSVSLYDLLSFQISKTPGIKLKTNLQITTAATDNLVYKAAQVLLAAQQKIKGLEITLQKNIPIAAGLAGGSADCAATLHGLNKLLKLGLTLDKLTAYANQFGSDIAFCLRGGTMLAEGRGEILTPQPLVGRQYGLILKPPFGISTAEVYRSIKNIPTKHLKNDLYPFALKIQPRLSEYLALVQKTDPVNCQMSGSGPAIFAFYANKKARNAAVEKLKNESVFAIETVKKGYQFN